MLDATVQKRVDDRVRDETMRVASSLRSQIEHELTATILLQNGLAAYYAVNPGMTYGEFEAFASDLILGARMCGISGSLAAPSLPKRFRWSGMNRRSASTARRCPTDGPPSSERSPPARV